MATTAFPTSPSFAGHETFTLRYGWLKKAVDAVHEDPIVFTRDDALVRLGVGKNMVRSIRHWGLATGILEEDTAQRISPFTTANTTCPSGWSRMNRNTDWFSSS